MKLSFQIATRFLKSGKFQTLMIIIGIAVGVSVQVFIGSLITGLQRSLVDRTIGSASQITVQTVETGTYISDYETKIAQIEALGDDFEIVSPAINTAGSLVVADQSEPTVLRGFDFERANEIYDFEAKLTSGRLPMANNEIALGSLLFETLGLSLGESIELQIPLIGSTTLQVVGVFDFNVQAVNKAWSIATLGAVQTMLGSGDVASTIEMQIIDVFAAEELSVAVNSALADETLKIDNWILQNAELLSGLQGQTVSSLMIQVFVMISVILAIASVLAITVLQKSKQIGILKAMGIKDKDASLVFLFEGLILGFFGAIGGVLLGLFLAFSFTTFALGPDGNPVVPLYIDYGFIALSAVIATFAATFAALIPARKSSKLSVIEVIRNA